MAAPQLTRPADLPRLLCVSAVPVESTYHGSALLYRLLDGYPADRLRIIEGYEAASAPQRRLPGVGYAFASAGVRRLANSRLHRWHFAWLLLTAAARAASVEARAGGFTPDAVLTVGHGTMWQTAAAIARRLRIPLHFIVHDDWPRLAGVPPLLAGKLDREFGRTYREAASRLCVSRYMVEEYRRRYGVDGEVLLPSRAADTPSFSPPPVHPRDEVNRLRFAFAGTINTPDYWRRLRMLAESIAPLGGELMVYGPMTATDAAANGLVRSNVRFHGMVPSRDLMARLRDEADVLFVPMSFAPADRSTMALNFPSKLTDYTAVGLPLLIWGPPDCSAVRWAQENDGVAEVVTADDPPAIAAAVGRLAHDSGYRQQLAAGARRVGDRDFSAAAAQAILHRALTAARMS